MDEAAANLFNKSLRYLSFRPRSIFEINSYLKKNKATLSQIDNIITKLKSLNIVNDQEYARKWLDDRVNFHPRSCWIIDLELKQKGISPELITNLYIEEDRREKDLKMVKNIVLKLSAKNTDHSNLKFRIKLTSLLKSKGFSWDIIKSAIDECLLKV